MLFLGFLPFICLVFLCDEVMDCHLQAGVYSELANVKQNIGKTRHIERQYKNAKL